MRRKSFWHRLLSKVGTLMVILFWVMCFAPIFLAIPYAMFKGDVDRFISNFNKDSTTADNMVYQTGDVRVYKFIDAGNTCYLADKQGLSTSLFCK